MTTHLTLERGVLWFEDGTEVSDVSVELLMHAPKLLRALKELVRSTSALDEPDVCSRLPQGSVYGPISYDLYEARSLLNIINPEEA